MSYKEHRRKHKRYPVRWKAAVVFERSAERPVLHTETFDLSIGGGAIRTDYGDLTGSMVTLLLAQPPRQPGDQPRMLKIQARVVSSAQTSDRPAYRHGMSFIRADGLEGLEELLQTAGAASRGAAESAAAAPAPAEAAVGRLAALKQAAQAKLLDDAARAKADSKEEREDQVSEALKRTYSYLKDLVEQLDVLKPGLPDKGYAVHGLPEFKDFAWDVGKLDLRTRETSPVRKLFTRVDLDYRLSKNKPMLKVERDYPTCEKLKQMLKDYKLDFTARDSRTGNGAIAKTTFGIPFEILCKLEFVGDYETYKILLKMRNVERFGMMEYTIMPEAVTQESLEELTGFILGETSKVGPLLLKSA